MPRRTFLKGLGVSLALPWLEVMSANAKDITTAGSMAEHEIPAGPCSPSGSGRGTDWLHAAGHRQELHAYPVACASRAVQGRLHVDDRAPVVYRRTWRVQLPAQRRQHDSHAKTLTSVDQQLASITVAPRDFPRWCSAMVRETGFGGPFPTTLS